jgi:hypothetical protein
LPDGHGCEFKLAVVVGLLGLRPIRILSLDYDCGAADRAVLRVVHNAVHASKDGCPRRNYEYE